MSARPPRSPLTRRARWSRRAGVPRPRPPACDLSLRHGDRRTAPPHPRAAGGRPPPRLLARRAAISRRRLAAAIGLRVFDRERGWAEALRDADYGGGEATAPPSPPTAASPPRASTGILRLYSRLPARSLAPGGAPVGLTLGRASGCARILSASALPCGIAFNADGARLAVGYFDGTRVDVLDGRSLAPLHPAATARHRQRQLPTRRLGRGRHAAGRRDATNDGSAHARSSPGRRRGAARGGACRRGRTR